MAHLWEYKTRYQKFNQALFSEKVTRMICPIFSNLVIDASGHVIIGASKNRCNKNYCTANSVKKQNPAQAIGLIDLFCFTRKNKNWVFIKRICSVWL